MSEPRRDAGAEPFVPPALAVWQRRWLTITLIAGLVGGAAWGKQLLWRIAREKTLQIADPAWVHGINAHGSAQVFGWMAPFLILLASLLVPGLWRLPAAPGRSARAATVLMLAGALLLALAGIGAWTGATAVGVAMVGGVATLIAAAWFVILLIGQFGERPFDAAGGFLITGAVALAASAVMNLWHVYATLGTAEFTALLPLVQTWQPPLRCLEYDGAGLLLILGLALRFCPTVHGLPTISEGRTWWALWLAVAGVVGECALWFAYRATGSHIWLALIYLPWLALTAAVALVLLSLVPWRPVPRPAAGAGAMRAAWAWLVLALLMRLATPLYAAAIGAKFSHAWMSATGQAFGIGFITQALLALATAVSAGGSDACSRQLGCGRGPLVMVNGGIALLVATMVGTDFSEGSYRLLDSAGVIIGIGLVWWTALLIGAMAAGRRRV